jgi:hypothetical protein
MDDIIKNKIDSLISKVNDGESRFKNSSLLNQSIQVLARGGDPIIIIDHLIKIIDEQNELINKYAIAYGTNIKK